MIITDAQVHIWGANTPERPWPVGRPAKVQQPVPFSKDDLIREMDGAGVHRVVVVPPSWEGDRNDLALEAAAEHPARVGIMGRLILTDRQANVPIAQWRTQPGMLGIRLTLRDPVELTLLNDPDQSWVWKEAEEAGIPIMVYPVGLLPDIGRIAQKYPDLKLVVDHFGLHRFKGNDAFVDFADLLALAKFPNVAVKATALPCFADDAYPYPGIQKRLRAAYDAFGPRRLFWGTDLTRLPCTYRQAITLFTEELPWLKGEDKEWVMGRAISEWLDWPVDAKLLAGSAARADA